MIKPKHLKIFDLYLFTLVLCATLIGIVAFIVVWISPETLFKVIHRVSIGWITPKQGVEWLLFEIPTILGKAIPVGLLMGTLVITDMLSRNFELVIFRSIGISFWRIARPIIVLSSLFAVFCFFAYNTLIPYSSARVEKIKRNDASPEYQWAYLEKDVENNPIQLIIVSNTNGEKMENINVFQITTPSDDVKNNKQKASMKKIIFAKNAAFTDDKLKISDLTTYHLSPDGIFSQITKQPEQVVLNGKTAVNASRLMQYFGTQPDDLTKKELKEYLKLLKEERINDEYNANLNNLYQRFAQTLSCIVFALCGLVLGWSRPRENRFLGFTIGACIIFAYYLTVPFINMLAEKTILPPIITAFLPITIISFAMFLYAKSKDL